MNKCNKKVGGVKRKPHRQICTVCGNECRVDFIVPNDIWELATHFSQRNALICLDCFTKMADARLVQWDRYIKFYPQSLITIIELTEGCL